MDEIGANLRYVHTAPFSFLSVLLIKTLIADFEWHCDNGLLTTNGKRFQMSPFSAFTLKTDRFKNALFSNLCIFISIFEQLRPYTEAMSTQGKNGYVSLNFQMKTEQCEPGLRWKESPKEELILCCRGNLTPTDVCTMKQRTLLG